MRSDTTMSTPDQEAATPFGRWVLRVLRAHSATYRSQRQRTGIPHSTVVGWVQGIPPRMENVLAFARGFGESERDALRLAGYVQPSDPGTEEWSPLAYLSAELARRAQERGEPLPVVWSPRAQDFTREEADAYLAELDRVLAEEDAANAATD